MRPAPKPGFLLVARREWRWLLHDRVALILIFGVPLFAFVGADRGVQPSGDPRARGGRRRRGPIGDLARLRGAGGRVSQSQHRRARRRSRLRGARDPLRRRHRRRLHPGQFRARPQGRAPPAGRRLLQPAVPDRRGHRVVGPERQPAAAAQRGVRGPRGAEGVPHRVAGRRDDRAGQSAEELRAVPAARAAADGHPCGHRARRRLRGGLRVPPAQHAHLARLRGRQSDRCAGRQACAPVRDLLRHHAVGGADPGGIVRDLVQGRRADDGRRGIAADRRLPGAGRADAAPGARPRDRARPHRPHRLARVRLRRRRISDPGHERVCAGLGRDPAAALVHGGAARAGGARTAAARIPRGPSPRSPRSPCSTRCSRSCACARSQKRIARRLPHRNRRRRLPRRAASAEPSPPSGGACSRSAAPSSCWCWRRWSTASITRSRISTRSCARSRSRSSTTI